MQGGLGATLHPWALWIAIGVGGVLGVFVLLRTGALPIRRLRGALRAALAGEGSGENEISPREAFLVTTGMSALPVVVGTATAIAAAGPGAVLWLWIAALALAGLRWLDGGLAFRHGAERRGAIGAVGALLGRRWTAATSIYAFVGVGAAGVAGAMLAGRTVADAAESAGWPGTWLAVGLGAVGILFAIARPTRLVRLTAWCTTLALAAILVGSVAAVMAHPERIFRAIGRIFSEGWNGTAPSGAFIGAFVMEAFRSGLALGVAPTAAAFGPASTVQAAARHGTASRAALAASFEPLVSVLVVSLLVALPIVTSRAWNTVGDASYPLADAIALRDPVASAAEAEDHERRFDYVTRFREGTTLDRIYFLGGRGMLEDVDITDRGEPLDAAMYFEDGHLAKLQYPEKRGPGRVLRDVPPSRGQDLVVHGQGLRRGAALVAAALEAGLPKGWGGTVVSLVTALLAIAALAGWTLFAGRATDELSGGKEGATVARLVTAAVGGSAAVAAIGPTPWLVPFAVALAALLALLHGASLLLGLGGVRGLTGEGGEG